MLALFQNLEKYFRLIYKNCHYQNHDLDLTSLENSSLHLLKTARKLTENNSLFSPFPVPIGLNFDWKW